MLLLAGFRIRTAALLDYVRTGYWPVPGAMAIGGVGLAVLMVKLDGLLGARQLPGIGWLYQVDAPGARAILSTIAASAISVAGVVFSITIVALSLASGQYGPRLLPNFMKQGTTKVVLGTFIATFIYCLLVLSAVRAEGGGMIVPHLAVALGMTLGVASFGVLIYFIHDVAHFIQAPRVIDDVAGELVEILARLFPEPRDTDDEATPDEEKEQLLDGFEDRSQAVPSLRTGYVQAIDIGGLVELAKDRGLLIRTLCRPGQFVVEGHALCLAAPKDAVDDGAIRSVNERFLIGAVRTSVQDAEFAVDQLVEVALRALSPGINDPFTAVNCLDRLCGALSFLAERRLPSAYRRDAEGRVRVVAEPYTYAGIVDAAFNQIRQHARTNAAVTIRLLEVIGIVMERPLPGPYRDALLGQAELVHDGARQVFTVERDSKDVEDRYQAILARRDTAEDG